MKFILLQNNFEALAVVNVNDIVRVVCTSETGKLEMALSNGETITFIDTLEGFSDKLKTSLL